MAQWPDGPASPILGPEDIHVWRIALDLPAHTVRVLERELSVEERRRSERFAFDVDRSRFVAGHGALRTILAGYLGTVASAIRFRYNEFGKPSLEEGEGPALRFNFSHSGSLALFAITRAREIGVDIERIAPSKSLEEIAERYFSQCEIAALRSLPVEQRHEAFFACWSRKEAYMKGRGLGLAIPLDSFDVSFAPGEAAALLEDRGAPEGDSVWAMVALEPAPGYSAALAVEGVGKSDHIVVSCYRWAEHRVPHPAT